MSRELRHNILYSYFFAASRAGLFTVPMWVVYQQEFLSFPKIAFFASLLLILTIVFELPTGVLADLWGKRKTLILGAGLIGLGFILIGSTPSYPMMYIHVLLVGIGESFISGSFKALIFDRLKEEGHSEKYPHISANITFIFQIVATLTILVGGYIYDISNGLPYILRGMLALTGIPFLFLMKEPLIDTETFSLKGYINQTKIGIKEAFKNSYTTRLAILYIFVSGFAFSNHRFFSQPFMVESALDSIQRSWLASAIKLFIGFLTIYLAKRKKLFESKNFLLLLPIIMVVSLIPINFVSFPLAIIFLVGIAFPSGTSDIFIGYPVNQQISSKYRATALSTLNMFALFVFAAGNYIGGLISDRYSVGFYYSVVGIFILVFIIPLTLNIIATQQKTNYKSI